MYTTLAYVKTYLWTGNSIPDDRLTSILNWIEMFVFNQIGDINFWDKTETINTCLIVSDDTIPLRHKKVSKIKTVNGVDYSNKVNGVDYIIRENDTVTIPLLCSLISNIPFDVFTIEYESWYSNIPFDLQNAIAGLVWVEAQKEMWKTRVSEKTWPRAWSFDSNINNTVAEALNIINQYKVLNLNYF